MMSFNYICAILSMTFIIYISRSTVLCQSYHYSKGWEPGKRDVPESRLLLEDGVQPDYDRWMLAKHNFHQSKPHFSKYLEESRRWSTRSSDKDDIRFLLQLPNSRCSQLLADITEFEDLTRWFELCAVWLFDHWEQGKLQALSQTEDDLFK